MIVFLEILFWISILGILQSYLIYPLIMWFIDLIKPDQSFPPLKYYPSIAVVFAAFNEEDVIEEKIHSIYKTSYPLDKLSVYIGSDASTDKTDDIVRSLQKGYSNLHFTSFIKRMGKAGIINELAEKVSEEIIIGTDANIIFKEDTIAEFALAFSDIKTDVVAGNIVYFRKSKEGISNQEEAYISLENKIKKAESKLWGKVMGVSGGLYAIRKSAFTTIPPLTFMEDFFVSFSVLANGGNVLFQESAIGYEDTSILQEEEFKRKTRISIGNFQNLSRFSKLLFLQPFPVGFAFLSHKILRWITPIMAIITILTSYLLREMPIYNVALYLQLSLLLLALIDWILYKLNIKSGPIRFIGHFVMMNLAFLLGFYKFLKGVSTNVWQPTKRNQE